MIKRCNCKHKDQDKIHGKGKRVMNQGQGPGGNPEYHCTVCGKTADSGVNKVSKGGKR